MNMKVELLTPHIGAVVTGVELARDLDDDTIAGIRAAWVEHLVLFFPDQILSPDAHVAFARRFGDITKVIPSSPRSKATRTCCRLTASRTELISGTPT